MSAKTVGLALLGLTCQLAGQSPPANQVPESLHGLIDLEAIREVLLA
jgi:hypothetical protein